MVFSHKMLRLIPAFVLLMTLVCADNKVASTLSSTVDGQALFIRNENGANNNRPIRQGSSTMDQTVQNILQWLQGKYSQSNRIARQQVPSRQYLPSLPGVSTTQKPRPFQTSAPTFPPQQPSIPSGSGNVDINVKGYPYQDSPTPEFNLPQRPSSTYQPSTSYQPSTAYDQPSSYQPPVQSTYQPPQSTYQPSTYEPPSFPTSTGYQPSAPPGIPSSPGIPIIPGNPDIPSQPPSAPDVPTAPGFPSSPDFFSPGPTAPGNYPSPSPSPSGTSTGEEIYSGNEIDSDTSHPPHIHEINVQCSKDRMTIDIEFNRQFDGVIYSKGYYGSQECRYVAPNSGQTKYTFTVMLNSCGTQFIDGFSEGKQAYLENVLVLQNEPGIQEVWDSVRSVRCLWEGNLNKALSVALSVDMLNQEVVTFSGDTATAKLDIQVGRGPFAPLANGLVKIGEPMTLVVTVEGDPAFNVLVRECIARDNDPNSGNIVKLTDEQGCVLKPKLIGAFQTTRNPETNSIIAYAFFQAFKFPDVMDLTIECNVELCKTECQPCSNPNQKLEPGKRRRRDISNSSSIADPVTLGRRFRVYLPEDIEQSSTGNTPVVINVGSMTEQSKMSDSVCLSTGVFITTFTVLLGTMTASCLATVNLWFKLQRSSANKK